jgi:hypothetical protein
MGEFKMQLTGDKELLRLFEELPAAAQNRVLKPLLRSAGAQIALLERGEAPTQSGLLKTSLGASTLRSYSSTLFITAGVRQGFRRAVQGTNYRGGFARKVRYFGKQKSADYPELPVQDPVRYLHLVTGGRKALSATNKKVLFDARTGKFFGKSVQKQDANPFIERAFDEAKNTVVDQITSEGSEKILAEAKSFLLKG